MGIRSLTLLRVQDQKRIPFFVPSKLRHPK